MRIAAQIHQGHSLREGARMAHQTGLGDIKKLRHAHGAFAWETSIFYLVVMAPITGAHRRPPPALTRGQNGRLGE